MENQFDIDRNQIVKVLADHTPRQFTQIFLGALVSWLGWLMVFTLIGVALSDVFLFLVNSVSDGGWTFVDIGLIFMPFVVLLSMTLSLIKSSSQDGQDWDLCLVWFVQTFVAGSGAYLLLTVAITSVIESGNDIGKMWLVSQNWSRASIALLSLSNARGRWIKLLDDPLVYLLEDLLRVDLNNDGNLGQPVPHAMRVETTVVALDERGNRLGLATLPLQPERIKMMCQKLVSSDYDFVIRNYAIGQGALMTPDEWRDCCNEFVRVGFATRKSDKSKLIFTDLGKSAILGYFENGYDVASPTPSDLRKMLEF